MDIVEWISQKTRQVVSNWLLAFIKGFVDIEVLEGVVLVWLRFDNIKLSSSGNEQVTFDYDNVYEMIKEVTLLSWKPFIQRSKVILRSS